MNLRQQVEEIFDRAVNLSSDQERAAYLDETCAGDEKLRVEVEALLKWDREAGRFLKLTDPDVNAPLDVSEADDHVGTVMGHYKLLEKVGEGGMATVYMAEQMHPIRRKVALKLIKLGMDSQLVIARFEAERQALALMDHPHIAQILDAGTTDDGRPYFVMELVKGISMTQYCDENRLDTRERLALFISVCQAVHHAHQRGIIHRDIKPSNVLVTSHDGLPVVKVIDFGIAKAINQELTEKTVYTRFSHMIGTPQYMSPEQAAMSGLDIDTRTDVFSLGVLLYELLTGVTPFESKYLLSKGLQGLQRIIRNEEPPKPSTKVRHMGEALTEVAEQRRIKAELLSKLLQVDLDWIVMKTQEKDRTRRYESVNELANDVQRYLNSEPVMAARPSSAYVLKKFIQRHRTPVYTAALVGLVVTVGFIVSTILYFQVNESSKRERAALAETKSVVDFFIDDLLASINPERAQNREVTVSHIINSASEHLNRFEDKPLVEARVREALGMTCYRISDFLGAERHLKRVLEIRQEHLDPDDPAIYSVMASLGRVYISWRGRYDEAKPLLEKALENQTRILGRHHEQTLQSLCDLAQLNVYQGNYAEGAQRSEEVLELGTTYLGEDHPISITAMRDLVWLSIGAGDFEKAAMLAQKGYALSRESLGEKHEDTLFFMVLVAWTMEYQGLVEEAVPIATKALNNCQEVLPDGHWVTIAAMSQLGSLYTHQGRLSEAKPLLVQSAHEQEQLHGPEHAATVFFKLRLVRLYGAIGEVERMDSLLAELVKTSQQAFGPGHAVLGYVHQAVGARIDSLRQQAQGLYDAGQYTEALQCIHACESWRKSLGMSDVSQEELALKQKLIKQLGQNLGTK